MFKSYLLSYTKGEEYTGSLWCVQKSLWTGVPKKDLHSYAYRDVSFKKASASAIAYCKDVMDAVEDGKDVEEVPFVPENQLDKMVQKVTMEFAGSDIVAKENSEAAFMQKHVLPLLRVVLEENLSSSFLFSQQDAASASSECRMKPDVLLCFADRKREVDCFLVEVKRPNIPSKYQVEDDYTKLLKQLKSSYDYQLNLGIVEPTCLGILCEGTSCSLVEMHLVEDGVYLPEVMRTFVLPKSFLESVHIPRAVETLEYAMTKLQGFEEKYKARSRKLTAEKKKIKKPPFSSVLQK